MVKRMWAGMTDPAGVFSTAEPSHARSPINNDGWSWHYEYTGLKNICELQKQTFKSYWNIAIMDLITLKLHLIRIINRIHITLRRIRIHFKYLI